MERLYINKIENGLRGLRLGTKTPQTCQCGKYLNKLKSLNAGMYEELLLKYEKHVKDYEYKESNKFKKTY